MKNVFSSIVMVFSVCCTSPTFATDSGSRFYGLWAHEYQKGNGDTSQVVLYIGQLENGVTVSRMTEQSFSYQPVLLRAETQEDSLELTFKMVTYTTGKDSRHTIVYRLEPAGDNLNGTVTYSWKDEKAVVLSRVANTDDSVTAIDDELLLSNSRALGGIIAANGLLDCNIDMTTLRRDFKLMMDSIGIPENEALNYVKRMETEVDALSSSDVFQKNLNETPNACAKISDSHAQMLRVLEEILGADLKPVLDFSTAENIVTSILKVKFRLSSDDSVKFDNAMKLVDYISRERASGDDSKALTILYELANNKSADEIFSLAGKIENFTVTKKNVNNTLRSLSPVKVGVAEYMIAQGKAPEALSDIDIAPDGIHKFIMRARLVDGNIHAELNPESGASGEIIITTEMKNKVPVFNCNTSTVKSEHFQIGEYTFCDN